MTSNAYAPFNVQQRHEHGVVGKAGNNHARCNTQRTNTQAHSVCLTASPTHQAHSHSHSRTQFVTFTHTVTLRHTVCDLTSPHRLPPTHTHSLSLSHTHTHTRTHTRARAPTHTHTHTHTRARTHGEPWPPNAQCVSVPAFLRSVCVCTCVSTLSVCLYLRFSLAL